MTHNFERYSSIIVLCIVLCIVIVSSTSTTAEESKPKINLKIEGTDKITERNIRLHIEKNDLSLMDQDIESRIRKITQRSLQAIGYYHPDIGISFSANTIILTINKNTPVAWTNPSITVNTKGHDISDMNEYLETLSIKPGNPLNHKEYEKVKADLLDFCHKNGFLNAEYIKSVLEINLYLNSATIVLNLDCGERFKYLSATFNGSQLNQQLLTNMTATEPTRHNDSLGNQHSSYYRRSYLKDLYRTLSDSGYFSEVEIERDIHENNTIGLSAHLQDKRKHEILTGIGFGTDTGPRAQLQWDRPILNNDGHSVFNKIAISSNTQSISSRYRIPSPHPLYQFIELQLGVKHEDIQNEESVTKSLGVSWHRAYPREWHRVISFEIENEKSHITGSPWLEDTYILPLISWTKTADTSLLFIKSYRIWLTLLTGQTWLGTATNFSRAQWGGKVLIPLGEKHQTIIRAEMGSIYTNEFGQVPLSQRFFTGGDQTVRGYEYESIGRSRSNLNTLGLPRLAEGGRFLNIFSIEYNWLLNQSWQLALFGDAGRAYNSFDHIDLNNNDAGNISILANADELDGKKFSVGVGVGVRWFSPIGQIRLDIADPVNDPDHKGLRLHLFLGTEI